LRISHKHKLASHYWRATATCSTIDVTHIKVQAPSSKEVIVEIKNRIKTYIFGIGGGEKVDFVNVSNI